MTEPRLSPGQCRDALAGGLAAGTPPAVLWRHARAFAARGLIPLAWCEEALGPEGARQPAAPPPAAAPRMSLPCVHRGVQPTGERLCPSCTGVVRVKTFACSFHGGCTLAKPFAGLACCATCDDYRVLENPPPR